MNHIDGTSLLNDSIMANKEIKYQYQLKNSYRHPKNELYSTCKVCLERFNWIHSKAQFIQLVNEYIKDDDKFDINMIHFYNNSYWPGRCDIRYNASKDMCGFCYSEKTKRIGFGESCKIYFVVIFHLVIVGVIIFALCMYS